MTHDTTVSLSSVGCRVDGESQGSPVAGAGHAQSVPAAGGAGSLCNNPNREPECVWIHIWSDRKMVICPLITLCHDLFSKMIDMILL